MTPTSSANLSDRAFRVLHVLTTRPSDEWVAVADIYTSLGLTSHQVRSALSQLHQAGMAERQRRMTRSKTTRRRTHITYFRLTADNTPSEATA